MVEVVRSRPVDRDDKSLTLHTLELEAEVYSNYLYVGRSMVHGRDVMGFVNELRRRYGGNVDGIIKELSNNIPPTEYFPVYNGVDYVISGSTVKGTVRANLELSLKPVNGKVHACLSVTGIGRGSAPSSRFISLANKLGVVLDRSPCTDPGNVCVLCDVFGTMSLSSRVFFTDFVPMRTKLESCNVHGSVYRVFTKGSRFVGKLYIWAKSQAEVGLVLIGMGVLGDESVPVLMGSWKYACRDFGLVRFSVRSASLDVGNAIKAAIQEYGKLGLDVNVVRGFYNAKISNEIPDTNECCTVIR